MVMSFKFNTEKKYLAEGDNNSIASFDIEY